ncbi:MAG: ComF family protein [Micrococcales bacterium]
MAESLHPALPKLAGKTLLIPVPSGSKATAERGFVPAQVLAKQLARLMSETRVVEGIWQRREVQDQAALNVVLRQTNIEGSMLASPGFARLKNTNLVLIDDVITTGASMTECQRALRAVGCEPSFLFAYAETLRKTAT